MNANFVTTSSLPDGAVDRFRVRVQHPVHHAAAQTLDVIGLGLLGGEALRIRRRSRLAVDGHPVAQRRLAAADQPHEIATHDPLVDWATRSAAPAVHVRSSGRLTRVDGQWRALEYAKPNSGAILASLTT